jgi:D-alanyl-D-alanine carboxypeptidase/D-alanyl-D-alanine-endopeptidase (penicillin-binding protein 4)
MVRILLIITFILIPLISYGQQGKIDIFLTDSSMIHASVSLTIIEGETGDTISIYNPVKSLAQASILKLVTTAVALEKLGKDYTFKTTVGYTGKIRKESKTLEGNIIIKGGGDPALGSENFKEFYNGFIDKWIQDIKALGINKVKGRIIADDSSYDYEPVPSGWSWDDIGNYYGAGTYGLSVFDNSLQIHFKTEGKGSAPVITSILPEGSGIEFTNFLTASGSSDNGYIFLAPYSNRGWISGTIPETLHKKLIESGVKISSKPATTRQVPEVKADNFTLVSETNSPPLSAIIEVMNHKSVNLYAEHLVKELGKVFRNNGTTNAGTEVIMEFLDSAGVNTDGMFIEDGSGLSSKDAVNSVEMVKLLQFMKKNGRFFEEYFMSLPDAGKEGTLKNYFKDEVFDSRLRAKSGSMTRVRSYAGYFTTLSGKEMIFCIIVNNYNGPSRKVISGIEEIIKDVILNR